MGNVHAFAQLSEQHDLLSDKLFFLSLGRKDQSSRLDAVVKSGGDIVEAKRHLDDCVDSAQKVKDRLDVLAARIGR